MLKNKTKIISDIYGVLILVLSVSFLIGFLGFYITILIKYGGKPLSEIPAWVAFFMFVGIRK